MRPGHASGPRFRLPRRSAPRGLEMEMDSRQAPNFDQLRRRPNDQLWQSLCNGWAWEERLPKLAECKIRNFKFGALVKLEEMR